MLLEVKITTGVTGIWNDFDFHGTPQIFVGVLDEQGILVVGNYLVVVTVEQEKRDLCLRQLLEVFRRV